MKLLEAQLRHWEGKDTKDINYHVALKQQKKEEVCIIMTELVAYRKSWCGWDRYLLCLII
jgi:hypothetical protein